MLDKHLKMIVIYSFGPRSFGGAMPRKAGAAAPVPGRDETAFPQAAARGLRPFLEDQVALRDLALSERPAGVGHALGQRMAKRPR